MAGYWQHRTDGAELETNTTPTEQKSVRGTHAEQATTILTDATGLASKVDQLQRQCSALSMQLEQANQVAEDMRRYALEAQAARLQIEKELHAIHNSPAWRTIERYREWLYIRRRTSRWIRSYERPVNWLLRRLTNKRASHSPVARTEAGHGALPVTSALPYEQLIANNEPGERDLELQRTMFRQMALQPVISILTPVYKVPLPVLRELVNSVYAQTYEKWELCIAHGYPEDQNARTYLQELAARDSRIKVVLLNANTGISGNSNAALELVTGEYTALLDHDDTLAPFALYRIAETINEQPTADFLYSDKDCLDENGRRVSPLFKPVWSPDTMLSANYLTHLSVIRTNLIREAGGWRSETDGAQDWDIFLRVIDSSRTVVFFPGVLYHWRISPASAAARGLEAKPWAAKGQLRAVNDHLTRMAVEGKAVFDGGQALRIRWTAARDFRASIILVSEAPTAALQKRARHVAEITIWPWFEVVAPCDGPVQKGIVWSGYGPGIAGRLNRAVEAGTGEVLVFLDDTVMLSDSNWLEELVGPLQQKEVGLAAPKTIDSVSRMVRNAGIVFNRDGIPDDIFSGQPEHIQSEFGEGTWYRNWSAVSGACVAIRRQHFDSVGGFRENPCYPRHDIDLCLRVTTSGRRIMYNPYSRFMQVGPAVLERWLRPAASAADLIRSRYPSGDPYFHPWLQSRNGKLTMTFNGQGLRAPLRAMAE